MKGRKGFPIKKFNNRNIASSIHKDNLSRFIDCLLYCSSGLESVLQMLAAAVLNIYAMQSQQAVPPRSHHLYN
jgi:hypothetical protein